MAHEKNDKESAEAKINIKLQEPFRDQICATYSEQSLSHTGALQNK